MRGDYGESLVSTILGQWTERGTLFKTIKIGGNWPTIDIYAETSHLKTGSTCIALFQVKSTEKPFTKHNTLPVQISAKKLTALSRFSAPTYLIGVQENKEMPTLSKAYIKSINGHYSKGMGAISTENELNQSTLLILQDEILNFWKNSNVIESKNHFKSRFK